MSFNSSLSEEEISQMLSAIGVKSFGELVSNIPKELRLNKKLNLPEPLSEQEMTARLKSIAKKNESVETKVSFLGAGAYDHFIPAAVDAIASRSEYYTAYTPYQAEVAQGTLQVMYEFQSLIAELTGMDVANASLYDGATALAEATLSSAAQTQKHTIVVAGKINPNMFRVTDVYAKHQSIELVQTKLKDGTVDMNNLKDMLEKKEVASVIVQQPNFYGALEDVFEIGELAKAAGAMYIVCVDPITLSVLEAPGHYGADIVVGEGQSLGCPLNFGGPYLGLYAVRNSGIRSLPGRLSGMTVDKNGKEGFILTLQTREQHIRRGKATSNICTSQSLLALRATVYMALMGKKGMLEVANQSTKKAHYLAKKLTSIDGVNLKYNAPFFREFAVTLPCQTNKVVQQLLEEGFFAGVDLSICDEEGLLIAVTEKRTKEEMDDFAGALERAVG